GRVGRVESEWRAVRIDRGALQIKEAEFAFEAVHKRAGLPVVTKSASSNEGAFQVIIVGSAGDVVTAQPALGNAFPNVDAAMPRAADKSTNVEAVPIVEHRPRHGLVDHRARHHIGCLCRADAYGRR